MAELQLPSADMINGNILCLFPTHSTFFRLRRSLRKPCKDRRLRWRGALSLSGSLLAQLSVHDRTHAGSAHKASQRSRSLTGVVLTARVLMKLYGSCSCSRPESWQRNSIAATARFCRPFAGQPAMGLSFAVACCLKLVSVSQGCFPFPIL